MLPIIHNSLFEGLQLPDCDFQSLDVLSSQPLNDFLDKTLDKENIFSGKKRKGWTDELARCNFDKNIRLTPRAGLLFFSYWKKTRDGRTLKDIKEDEKMIPFFAEHITWLIKQAIGENLDKGDFAVCTTPKRRHKINNFAENITILIANNLNIKFYQDVAVCHSKHQINAVFELNNIPKENNIIIVDDFVTTGSTLESMKKALLPLEKIYHSSQA